MSRLLHPRTAQAVLRSKSSQSALKLSSSSSVKPNRTIHLHRNHTTRTSNNHNVFFQTETLSNGQKTRFTLTQRRYNTNAANSSENRLESSSGLLTVDLLGWRVQVPKGEEFSYWF